mgnify:CR=1 FL=1
MPRIISFGWTWPAVVAKEKCVTRRDWNDKYALSFEPGEICHAWDFSPRSGHGKWIADIKIKDVYFQNTSYLKDNDYVKEGFLFLDDHKLLIPQVKGSPLLNYIGDYDPCHKFFLDWKEENKDVWVVEFEVKTVDTMRLADMMIADVMLNNGVVKI